MASPSVMASPPPAPQRSASTSSSSAGGHVSYEKFAPRSTAQVSRLSRIAALTAGPTAVATSTTSSGDALGGNSSRTLQQAMTPPSLERDEWDDWKYETDTDQQQQQEQLLPTVLRQTLHVSDGLTQQLKHTTSLRLALRASINISEDISNRHADLIRHSGELSAAADRLQEEEAVLTRHAADIGKPLQHYDAVDRIGVQVGVLFKGKTVVRGLAKLKVDHEDFSSVLDEIDNAVEYFGRESGGKEALQEEMKRRRSSTASTNSNSNHAGTAELMSGNIEYYRRAMALQEAALYLIKEAVAERITNTTAQIASALSIPKKTVQADQLEASLIYTRYHGISSRSNRLLGLVKARLHRSTNNNSTSGSGDAYPELLHLCRTTYCTQRESLLLQTVRAHMDKLKEQHGPVGMTRLASVFLIRLCTVETALYLDFFGDNPSNSSSNNKKAPTAQDEKTTTSTTTTAAPAVAEPATTTTKRVLTDDPAYKEAQFQQYLTTLCSALHRTVRRSLVTMLDLDTLCQIVSVLREERSTASSSPITMAAARAISSVIEDAQERLIFCANSTLQREVIRFKATPKDLDYPDKLIQNQKKKQEAAEQSATAQQQDAAAAAGDGGMDAVEKQLEQVYESWFPPMRSVLHILSKIFRVVEPRVFEDMALQSVQACTKSLKAAGDYIQQRKGQMHSDLFLVKHLLILREQLSPFDIELRSVERQLDFSDAGKAVARFLANRNRRLFTMNTSENALFTLLREGVSVQEAKVDSKRDLEDALRTACNDFIEHTSRRVAAELLDLVNQCKSSDTMNDLALQALLNAEAVETMLTKTVEGLQDGSTMSDVTTQMALYLDNPGTQSILLKPVSRKVTRAAEDLRKIVAKISVSTSGDNNDNDDDDAGWNQETRERVEVALQAIERAIKQSAKASSSSSSR